MERQILVNLEFNLHKEITLNFIERYLELYRLDKGLVSHIMDLPVSEFEHTVKKMSLYLGRHTLREAAYLNYKPSQLASAVVLLTLNAFMQKGKLPLDLSEFEEPGSDVNMIEDSPSVKLADSNSSLFSINEDELSNRDEEISSCVIGRWTNEMESLTGV